MSWMKALYDTYNNMEQNKEKNLLEIAHSTQNAHLTIVLDENGKFLQSNFVEKGSSETIIPVTEESASRGSGNAPHALFDKLKYVAGDFEKYCGEDNHKYFSEYMDNLGKWCQSEFSDQRVTAVYKYLSEKHIIEDLVRIGKFSLGEDGHLTEQWENAGDKKLSSGKQKEAFIRFDVEKIGQCRLWEDKNVRDKYIKFYLSNEGEMGFCYVTGKVQRLCKKHPSKIRNTGDKAKLISSNDTENFTYRGIFENAKQAYAISYEASQKAHNALKCLINKQGVFVGDKVFVFWALHDEKLPPILADTKEVVTEWWLPEDTMEVDNDTGKKIAEKFKEAIRGYHREIKQDSQLVLLGLDAATTGRLSVIFNREYNGQQGNELIDSIESWHTTCRWNISYQKGKKKIYYEGAPSPINIARVVHGIDQNGFLKGDSKVIANTVERIMPCIIERKKIPRDIVRMAVNKAKFPQNYKDKGLWQQVQSVACALYRKYLYDYERKEITMEVIETEDLDYNCGRLLAVADAIESWALWEKTEDKKNIRTTNAMRYYTRFCQKPCNTWWIINKRLVPYKNQLGGKAKYLYDLMGEISSKIPVEEFKKKRNLDGKFCLGFDSQRMEIVNHNINKKEQKNGNITK